MRSAAGRISNWRNSLEVVDKDTGRFYNCLSSRHDDLGISCAMAAWAARHPHLPSWIGRFERSKNSSQATAATEFGGVDVSMAGEVSRR